MLKELRGTNLYNCQGLSREQIQGIIDLSIKIKKAFKDEVKTPVLDGKTLSMIFEQPSTRTRVSFEVGMQDLGGRALYLAPGQIHFGGLESTKDTARVISRFSDSIMARLNRDETMQELMKYATVPVINGLCHSWHPTQMIADILTMYEYAGDLSGKKIAFLGDATNVCNSLVIVCSKMGMHLVSANPRQYRVCDEFIAMGEENCKISKGKIEFTEDPIEAVRDADFVYTDLWYWLDQLDEAEKRESAMKGYQVTHKLLKYAKPTVKFMHCLPASRGKEVVDDVMDDESLSIIYDQAENRMHAHKAILCAFLGPSKHFNPSDEYNMEIAKMLEL